MEDKIINSALKILRKTKSNETVSIVDLIKETQLADDDILNNSAAMLMLWDKIMKAAKKEKIFLESLLGKDADIGMPYTCLFAVKRKYDKSLFAKDNIVSISYKRGGAMCCTPDIDITINKNDAAPEVWESIIDLIFDDVKPQNWYDSYVAYFVLDGYYWNLDITFKDGNSANYSGSNREPHNLKKLEKILRPYGGCYVNHAFYID